MQFANPIWLWALAGLSIPVGIHLLSRKEGRVIRIGSLRHLQETNTQQFKGIRLNEIVLLTLRCLLVILFVLLISGLSIPSEINTKTKWVLIEKGLEMKPEIKTQVENFQKQEYELRWLAAGFPLMDDSSLVLTSPRYWKIAEQLKMQNISETIVIAKNRVNSFAGIRPSLPSNIRWISVATEPADFTLNAIALEDSISLRSGHTSAEKTYFTTQLLSDDRTDSDERKPIDTIPVTIVADKLYQYDKKVVTAALKVIDQSFSVDIKLVYSTAENAISAGSGQWYIWLSDQLVSDSVSSNVIYLIPDLSNEILVQEKATRWRITKRLNEEIALNKNLTIQLALVLIPSAELWEIALKHDHRMLPDESAWSKGESEDARMASLPTQSAESYLMVIFLATLLVERMLAYYRNQ